MDFTQQERDEKFLIVNACCPIKPDHFFLSFSNQLTHKPNFDDVVSNEERFRSVFEELPEKWSHTYITSEYPSVGKIAERPFETLSKELFELFDKKLPDDDKINELIKYIRNKSTLQYREDIAAQLDYLYEEVRDDPEEEAILPDSLIYFINFLQNSALSCPDVGLTPLGEIDAEWHEGSNRHFSVDFLPTGEVRYVIFKSNPNDPEKTDRLSGITTTDSLIHTIRPHGVLNWAS